jgi:hypothetical protein
MNKIFLIFIVLFYGIPAVAVPSCHAALNLAKGKTYSVSPPQNYPFSAPQSNTTALTDGVYTVGYFWTQKTTESLSPYFYYRMMSWKASILPSGESVSGLTPTPAQVIMPARGMILTQEYKLCRHLSRRR